jgi:hypothetical protein
MPEIRLGLPIDCDDLRAELPREIELRQRAQKYYEFDASGVSFFLYILTWAGEVPAGIIAHAIWESVSKHLKRELPKRILIDETRVEFDEGATKRFVQKRVEYREGAPQ